MNAIDREEQLGQVIAEFLKADAQGERPDLTTLVATHPQFADELRSFCVNHDQMQADAGYVTKGCPGGALSDPGLFTATLSSHRNRSGSQRVNYFGDYELVTEVARGGMGVVYKARQVNLNRIVALKMILAGQLASAEDVRRFYQEAESAARLEHPGIVPIFEVGQHEGQHFFSMGYVDGPNLAQVIAEGPLTANDTAAIVLLVTEAIAFAHDRGVIHRDLKPANVLLARPDDATQAVHLAAETGRVLRYRTCQPKVTDFGLAKRTGAGADRLTGTGQILGTPSYMSPEQASGRSVEIGVASDVYSLGAILYAALTGHAPFQADCAAQIVRQVLECEPVPPRQLNPAIPRDLETICLKCLEKDPRKRYDTARGLADELRRFLGGEPICARRISRAEHLWRWCRRKPALAGFWGLCALVLLAASIGGPLLALYEQEVAQRQIELRQAADVANAQAIADKSEAERLRRVAQDERAAVEVESRRAQQNLVATQFLLGKIARGRGDTAEALSWYLQAYLNAPEGDRNRDSARNLIGAWGGGLRHTLVHDSGVHALAVSGDGRVLMSGYFGSQTRLWDLSTGQPRGNPQSHAGDVVSAEISPDGIFALTGDWEGAKVWNVATGELRYPMLAHEVREDTVVGPVISPDGRTIATRSPFEGVRLWDAKTGHPRGESMPHGEFVWRMLFSPDSQWVASLGGSAARIWEVETGKPVGEPLRQISDLAFHPHDPIVAVCRQDGQLLLREFVTGKELAELTNDTPLHSVQFDQTGRHLLTMSSAVATLWRDAATDQPKRSVLNHGRGLFAASFSPDGKSLLTAGHSLLRIWQVDTQNPLWERSSLSDDGRWRANRLKSASFGPDSRSVLVRTENNTANVFAASNGQLLAREQKVLTADFTADGTALVVGGGEGWVRVRELQIGPRHTTVPIPTDIGSVHAVAFSPDGRLAVLTGSQGAQLCHPDTWEPIGGVLPHEWPVTAAVFSPDSRTLVTSQLGERKSITSSHPGQLRFWESATGLPIGEPIALTSSAWTLVFDATGETLLAGSSLVDMRTRKLTPIDPFDPKAATHSVAHLVRSLPSPVPKLWDATRDGPVRIRMPLEKCFLATLLPDGRRLLTTGQDGNTRLWDAETGTPLGPSFQVVGTPRERTPDGRFVLFGSMDTLRLWDPYSGLPCGEPLLDEMANSFAAFSPSGDTLATLWHFTAQLWDSATGQALSPPLQQRSNGGTAVMFPADGKELLVLCRGVQRYRLSPPAANDPDRLKISVAVRTGLQLDENGALQKLSQAKWLELKSQLDALGGPCDVGWTTAVEK